MSVLCPDLARTTDKAKAETPVSVLADFPSIIWKPW